MPHSEAASAPTGVIHDIGYQRYTGPRLGRGYAARSLYVHSVRTAFGIGRSGKSKVFPWFVVGIAFAVALIAVAIRSQSGTQVITYLQFPDTVGVPVLLLLAIMAPELVSRELRAQVLPLYFSRPLRRTDYALVKFAALATSVWLVFAGPQLLMFLGGAFSRTDGASGTWHEFTDLLGGVSYAAIASVVFSAIAILVASLSGRRAVAAAAIVAVFLVTVPVVAVIEAVGTSDAARHLTPAINPVGLVEGLKIWLYGLTDKQIGDFGPAYLGIACGLVAACTALLLARYRKVAA
jgi:ABC-2 type transport system permease protein